MKKLTVKILETYKSYKKDSAYDLIGDLVILSGINGSGKSQLLNIISNNSKDRISRYVTQTDKDGCSENIENIMLLSFRDNINIGNDFGQYSITYQNNNRELAWSFYNENIKHDSNPNRSALNSVKTRKYNDGSLIYDNNGIKKPVWRSIIKLTKLIDEKYKDDQKFILSQNEIEELLPKDFIWRNENDIIQQVGNLFYMACCDRVNKQIECSKTSAIFNNEEWLKNAPWTILNQLFDDLRFKYRFKDDYEFKTPNMEENPKLRDGSEIRSLLDLSDGEKAILKLALISLDEEISKDIKLVLFDEYEAPLNPSLTEAFYHVINKFYIKKDIQVIITTHSPATISLAPDYAKFYEVFSQGEFSPKVVEVNKFDYEELKQANKSFYDKIKNQEERITELENISQISGKLLLVEDKYDQIYKIAYLKLKNIDELTEENLEQKFAENADFCIHGNYATGGLYNVLSCANFSRDSASKIICLFDFDSEGFSKFKKTKDLKMDSLKIYGSKEGTVKEGLYVKHKQINKYALLLPIPERLCKYVSEKSSTDCFVEVETLLSEEYLQKNPKAELRSSALPFYKMKDKHKNDFWKDLLNVDKKFFVDFEPLFLQIEKMFNAN